MSGVGVGVGVGVGGWGWGWGWGLGLGLGSGGNAKDTFDISWIQKEGKCWVYQALEQEGDIYQRGVIKGIIPLTINKANSKVTGILETGSPFDARAHQIYRCRSSNSIERDLIQMDIINAPQVLRQLKRRLAQKKIHTLIWSSLIIINPYRLIAQNYGQVMLNAYYQHIYLKKEDMKRHQPHIYSFMLHILANLRQTTKTQVVSISGESGSGKTQTNKEALKSISYCCAKMHEKDKSGLSLPQSRILKCAPILQTFGNAKTIKNDNSSRFGKLITLIMDGRTMRIHQCLLKNYFLEKSRIIIQSPYQRNFHIFYQLLAFLPESDRNALKLKAHGRAMQHDDFRYLTNRNINIISDDKHMWDQLINAFSILQFGTAIVKDIWSVVAATLLLGNLEFQSPGDDEPCQVKNMEVAESVSFLLGLPVKELILALTTHKRVIAGQTILSPLTIKLCEQGRDSVSKTMYESLFSWLVQQLNNRLNKQRKEEQNSKIVKLLDIYGFQVFDHNSFEQLCVNYTNQKIHQIYLEQIFVYERNTFKKEGLEAVVKNLNFTDNIKIIDLIQANPRSLFNLLDQSCTVNVKDDDFLSSIKKVHDQHQQFPHSNRVNTRKSFMLKHTPGDIQYMIDGFRQKNKDLIRQDLLLRLSETKIKFIGFAFKQKYEAIKTQSNKRFLSIKIRKQVKQLVTQMSTNTDMHFIRCIKPNEHKEPFLFNERVSYNQIRYLGILDTIQLRKDTYHIRTPYSQLYQKYGLLNNGVKDIIDIQDGKVSPHDIKEITMKFINDLNVHYDLDYQFGRERVFLKMSAQNRLDTLLSHKLSMISYASDRIKAQWRHLKMSQQRKIYKKQVPKIQRTIRRYLIHLRVYRRKLAVRKIQNAWIQYHEQFYARKKLPFVKAVQKYIKRKLDHVRVGEEVAAVRKAKELLKQIALANRCSQKVEDYRMIKGMMKGQVFQNFWLSLKQHYLFSMQKYFRGGASILQNYRQVKKAQDSCYYRLNIKHRRSLQKYLKGLYWKVHFNSKVAATIKLQTWFRMLKMRRKFTQLRDCALKIQKNWRKYYYDKIANIHYTQSHFQDGQSSIRQQDQYWKGILHRGIEEKTSFSRVEKLFQNNERVKTQKIWLFYYLLDFQILTDLSHLYPDNSWVENYTSIYEQAWQKGNPVQTVNVSDKHTVVSSLNKVYVWGDLHFNDFDPDQPSYQSWKTINQLQLPAGKLHRIHAHNQCTAVQIQNEQTVIVGNKKMYEEDCSSKEWKTLSESYLIINGVVLTLKQVQFSRVPINQKVVQLSCGMAHCIARTSLRKVFTWGDNSCGQLGLGHYKRSQKPKLVEYLPKHAIIVQQVAASASGSLILDTTNRLFWWGSNGSIRRVPIPKQVYTFQKNSFLDNSQKYTIVRILTSWSKSLSIIGVTVAAHQGIFKSSQNQIKRKSFQNLINKWNEDILTVMPPYVLTISGYFQQKLMPKPKLDLMAKNQRQLQNQHIRQKILNELMLMEEAERILLKQRRRH